MRTRTLALALTLLSCSSRTLPPAAPAHAAAPTVPPPQGNSRLPNLARPTHYSLSLALDPRQHEYSGEVHIDVEIPEATRVIVLHARELRVTNAAVLSGQHALTAAHTSRRAVGGREADEELVLTTDEPIAAGRARIDVTFTGHFSPELRGAFRVRVGDDWYAYSDFEPTDARRAFPCFDEPGFKVPFDVSVTAPEGMLALANMPEESHTDDVAHHTRTFRFATTPPVPTYLVAFAAGPFEILEGPREPVPVRVVTVRGRSQLGRLGAETAAAHLRVLGDYFGRQYPYPKLDLLAVPDFLPGAMENPGLITFRDTALLLDPEHAPTRAKYHLYAIIAHELAHQWFGNLVTMAWWNDLWLNEGFATWAATRVLHTWRPELGARLDEVGSAEWAREADALAGAHAIRFPVNSTSDAMEAFDGTTYSKGSAILGMLEAHIGEDHFREGVRAYLHAHEWGNATADDLLSALSTAAGHDIAPIASTFLDQAGVPLVEARLECAAGQVARAVLRQSRFTGGRPAEGDATRWQIPVCMRFPAGTATHERCVLMADVEHTETLDTPAGVCPAWLQPNANVRGYYLYQMSPAATRALVASPATLSPAEKLDLLANLEALLHAGALDAGAYLDVLGRLARDSDSHVVERVVGQMFMVERELVTEASRADFRRWVTERFVPAARLLGWSPNARDDEAKRNLRRTMFAMLGMLTDDPWVRGLAEETARRYLADPRSVEGDLASVALPIASRHADAQRFDALRTLLDRAENTPQDRAMILSAMVSFDDLTLVRRAYALVLTDAIHMQDLRVLFGRTGASPAARALLLDWARENIAALHTKLGRHLRAIAGAVGNRCEEASIREAETFLQEHLREMEGVERGLRQSGELARRCAALRTREAEHAAAAFRQRRAIAR